MNRRRRIMENKIQYTEIKYLESTGTQYIDTGIKLHETSDTNYTLEIGVNVSSNNSNYAVIFNAMYEVSPYPGEVMRYETSDNKVHCINGATENPDVVFKRTYTKTGTVTAHNVNSTLFAGYNGDGNPWRYCKMKLYYCKITNHGVLVRDFIPVRVGTTGCLYDKISGKLFYNNGTGNFTCGPDKTEIQYVDLGLPSGILWAKCNVGASNQEEEGLYFSWANVEGHTPSEGYNFSSSTYSSTTGNTVYFDSIVGNPTYDAATDEYDSPWHLPTRDDFTELINNCTKSNATINGVNGIRFTGPNGNTLFFPTFGYYDGTSKQYEGLFTCIWSSKASTYSSVGNPPSIIKVYALGMLRGSTPTMNNSDVYKYLGCNVRAVCTPS